jgi:hypothetical protein
MAAIPRMTFEDLAALPDDENRHELVRGEIIPGFTIPVGSMFPTWTSTMQATAY